MKFYGQYINSFFVDEYLYNRYFQTQKIGSFIECGAYDGIEFSSCKFFEDIGWFGINIEPHPINFSKLEINRPKSININVALGNVPGKDFLTVEDSHFGACGFIGNEGDWIKKEKKEFENRIGAQLNYYKYPIEIKTYSQIITENNVQLLDLFVLDVEGFELKVIENMLTNNILPSVICVEYGHVGLQQLKQALNEKYIFDANDNINAYFHKNG